MKASRLPFEGSVLKTGATVLKAFFRNLRVLQRAFVLQRDLDVIYGIFPISWVLWVRNCKLGAAT